MNNTKESASLDTFQNAPVWKAVLKNAIPAMGAATASLIINLSRQGIVFIPALFIMQALIGLTGLVWAQPVADLISILLAAVLYVRTYRRFSTEVHPAVQTAQGQQN